MSYDVYFNDRVTLTTIELKDVHFMRGGTYAVGGTKELHLNITYNYARVYAKHNFSIRQMDNKTALEVMPELERVIALLGNDVSDDYWKATEGNAKKSLDFTAHNGKNAT